MRNPTDSPDGVVQVFLPFLVAAHRTFEWMGLPPVAVSALVGVVQLGLYAALLTLLVRVRRRAADRRAAGLLAVLSAAVLGWIVAHPSPGFEVFFARGDHLVFAALGGPALRLVPLPTRVGVLTLTSLAVLVYAAGPWPVGITLAGMASGVAAMRLEASPTARGTALVQGAIMATTFAACAWRFTVDPFAGLGAQGLFAFMLLRHVSWVVDVRRGAGGSLLDYGCYQLFYPSCYGSTERYADFRTRNPDLGTLVDDRQLFRSAMRGAVYLWLVFHMSVDLTALLASSSWPAFAFGYLLLFVRSSLFLMAIWSALEALALAWGVRIHPNFSGILAARSPSQFWYAWRGTMTRWLVEYVYIPLGGGRAHQVRNVCAVFTVSAAWHWMGIPFLRTVTNPLAPADFVPVGCWAFVNAIVLAVALTWRRHGWRVWPSGTPALVRSETARLGTWVFGGVTATFLAFQGDLVPRFPAFVLRLVGLG